MVFSDSLYSEMRRASAVLLILITAAACSTEHSVRQYLDAATASTVTVGANTVFARDRPEFAANLRDYIDITPIEVNRGGKRVLYLYCDVWSTIDRRGEDALLTPNSLLNLVADGRVVPLKSSAKTLREAGVGEQPIPAPSKSAQTVLAEISVEALRSIANANQIYVTLSANGAPDSYQLWKDRRSAIDEFLAKLGRQ